MSVTRGTRLLAAGVTLSALGLSACGNSSTSAASCGTAKIAFFGALTGDSANLGINENNGLKLAVSQYNAKAPNCKVEAVQFDSQGDPAQAPALAKKVIDDSKIIGVVGPAYSGESKAADPIFNEAGLPIITASATNVTLSTNGWTIFHRGVGNDSAQGGADANYILQNLAAKKVAVVDDASEYGKGIAEIVRGKVKAANVDLVSDTIDPKGTDFSSTVTKVKAQGPDVVFYGGYYQAAGVLAKQLKDGGVTAKFMAPDGSEDPGFVAAAGPASEGAFLTAPAAPIDKVEGGPDFTSAYKAMFNTDPGLYSVEAFDAGNIFLESVKAGKFKRADVSGFLKTVNFKGLSKTYQFDDKGELSGTVVVYLYQVENGVIKGVQAINA
jgi:branched-chain amino acid transport system substrate-binding protein